MRANHSDLPIDGLHAYNESRAAMQIRVLSVFLVVDLKGSALTRTETVNVLNIMAIMAPVALIDPAIRWRQIDDVQVEAPFRNGPYRVRAALVHAGRHVPGAGEGDLLPPRVAGQGPVRGA
jgi:hypothetical protein